VLRAQFAIVYFFAGAAKIGSDWLVHGQPLRLWLGASSGHPVFGWFAGVPSAGIALSWAGMLFDVSVPFLLLVRRTRLAAYVVLILFHASTATHFQIGIFPFVMCLGALVFFEPDWPARVVGRLVPGRSSLAVAAPATAGARPTLPGRVAGVALGVYFLAQLLAPLRFALYPGSVLWTEEGFRFSWRVMLMEKTGVVDLRVVEPGTGRSWMVAPRDYLTADQARMMATQPDMILAFAHLVGRDFAGRGVRSPSVYADAYVSLNGRPAARFIDPTVDLYAEREGFAPKRFVLPAPEGPPP
jgi:vitamin K-dependent gamma-carboxylase